MRAVTLTMGILLCLGCEPLLSAETLRLTRLPADVTIGPPVAAVATGEGRVFVAPLNGGFLRLSADGTAWEALTGPVMEAYLPDFQEALVLARGAHASGVFRAQGDDFAGFEPPVPVLSHAAFSNVGWSALRGRDASGRFWATAAPTFGAIDGRLFLARLEPSAPAQWQYEEVPLVDARQTIPAASPAMTSDGRFFFRPYDSGVWEVDRAARVLVERVACSHELFRPSHPDYVACQEDTVVFAGRDGALLILNPSRELWRIPPGGTSPERVVQGELPQLDRVTAEGFNRYGPMPDTYVDPTGRVWMSFRWGEKTADDTSYLYVADPARSDRWTFLSRDLPRNVRLFGAGATPLITNVSLDTGLLLFRIEP